MKYLLYILIFFTLPSYGQLMVGEAGVILPACNVSAITGTKSACAGSTSALSDATSSGVWSSSSTSVATVGTSGTVTGVSAGTATISYVVGACNATTTFTVNAVPASISGTLSVSSGSTTQLTDATAGGTWASASTSIATVGTAGLVTGVSAGTSTISYTLSTGCYATAVVTVTSASASYSGIVSATAGTTTSTRSVITMNTSGKKLIVVECTGLGTPFVLTDNQSNTWTSASTVTQANCVYHQIYYVISPSTSATHTFTLNASSNGCASVAGQVSMTIMAVDCSHTPVLDQTLAVQSSASAQSTATTTSLTPAIADEIVFGGFCMGNGSTPYTFSIPSVTASDGTANNPGNYKGSALGAKIVTSTGAVTITCNITPSGTALYVWQAIAFR